MNIESFGRGPPLVLVHGWGMHSGVWRKEAQELARQFQVHLVDLPGHGKSKEEFSAGFVAALSARLPGRLNVVGWSLGATIALNWALAFPAQARRLALISATPCFGVRADWDCGWPPEKIEVFERELDRGADAALERFISLQARGESRTNLRRLRRLVSSAKPPSIASLKTGLDILKTTDLRSALPGISQPAVVMHGDCDAVVPLAAAKFLASSLPNARLSLFSGCGHAPSLSRPGKFIADLVEFFDG
ncbi:MAG: alpha/beta fold hydrolase [Burkholderiales bacterium]